MHIIWNVLVKWISWGILICLLETSKLCWVMEFSCIIKFRVNFVLAQLLPVGVPCNIFLFLLPCMSEILEISLISRNPTVNLAM